MWARIRAGLVMAALLAAGCSTGPETIALGTAPGGDLLRASIDAILADLYRSGEIVPIFERHFGPMTAADRAFYGKLAASAR